jgi:serine/threonine protein kinase
LAQIGQRVSEYVLNERLGAGTFGEVWRAHHHVWIDHVVAIKFPTDLQYARTLQKEGRAIHGLVHPNIVRAIGFDPYSDPPYLVMEHVPGKNLRQMIGEKRISVSDAVEVMKQVLAALGYAHQRGIVHRDVKPENILVHERAMREGLATEGVVKVTDFGLGKPVAGASGSIVFSGSAADAGKIAGSVEYMAPEQKAGGEVDRRADLYACGVILYEMLVGERPAGTEVPSDRNGGVPIFLDEVFRRSYARLEKRFASAEEFAIALNAGAVRSMPPPLPQMRVLPIDPAAAMCPHCRRQIDKGDQFCMHCGMQLVKEIRRCLKCGGYPDASDRFCLFCGEVLAEIKVSA